MSRFNICLGILSIGTLLLQGCHSVKVCNQGGRCICTAENSCLKILGFIPVASGDIEAAHDNDWVCWEDTTSVSNNVRLVERAMNSNRAIGIRDVTSYRTEEQVVIFLLKLSTLHTSAELIRTPIIQ